MTMMMMTTPSSTLPGVSDVGYSVRTFTFNSQEAFLTAFSDEEDCHHLQAQAIHMARYPNGR